MKILSSGILNPGDDLNYKVKLCVTDTSDGGGGGAPPCYWCYSRNPYGPIGPT